MSPSWSIIQSEEAPAAIGPYSQAVRAGDCVYISGQIPLRADGTALVDGDISIQAQQVFRHLSAIAGAAGGSLSDCVKINISLLEIDDFSAVNAVMADFFSPPYPARACVQAAALPRSAAIEVEAVLYLPAAS